MSGFTDYILDLFLLWIEVKIFILLIIVKADSELGFELVEHTHYSLDDFLKLSSLFKVESLKGIRNGACRKMVCKP